MSRHKSSFLKRIRPLSYTEEDQRGRDRLVFQTRGQKDGTTRNPKRALENKGKGHPQIVHLSLYGGDNSFSKIVDTDEKKYCTELVTFQQRLL